MIKKITDALSNEYLVYNDGDWNSAIDRAIEIVQEVAKEYGNGWIPCSERLPEDGQRIIATFTDGSVYQVDFKLFLHENPQYAHNHNVIAWQPLPTPYQKGE